METEILHSLATGRSVVAIFPDLSQLVGPIVAYDEETGLARIDMAGILFDFQVESALEIYPDQPEPDQGTDHD